MATDLRIGPGGDEDDWAQCQRFGSRYIVVSESYDLLAWSEPRLLPVAPPEAGNAWAPEAYFDESTQSYLIYWASVLYQSEQARVAGSGYNRMLAASTVNFRSVHDVRAWVDPGHSVIDATVVEDGGYFYRFIKDERSADSSTPAAKFITLERSRSLSADDYTLVGEGIGSPDSSGGVGVVHGEGPIAVRSLDGSHWYLFIDEFGLRRYLPFESARLDAGSWRLAVDHDLPAGASHGSILELTSEEWISLGALKG